MQLVESMLVIPGEKAQVSVQLLLIHYVTGCSAVQLIFHSLARRLPLASHLVVQALGLVFLMPHNKGVCNLVMQYPAAPTMLNSFERVLNLSTAVLPGPIFQTTLGDPLRAAERQCMVVTGMLQVLVGFSLPTALITVLEGQEVSSFAEGCERGRSPPTVQGKLLLWVYRNLIESNGLVSLMMYFMLCSIIWLILLVSY